MIECVLSHNLDILVELFSVTTFIGVRIPVVATRTDADDATLAIVSRILPGYDSAIAANTKNLTAGTVLPCWRLCAESRAISSRENQYWKPS